jgi:hypothetical protein
MDLLMRSLRFNFIKTARVVPIAGARCSAFKARDALE